MNAFAVHCRGICTSFGEGATRLEVLRGVDFEARSGKLPFIVVTHDTRVFHCASISAQLDDGRIVDVRPGGKTVHEAAP